MSVEIYNIPENPCDPSEIYIGVSSERVFNLYWEKAFLELGINSLGNGVWLYRDEQEDIYTDFRRVREWAVKVLPAYEAEYITSHIDRILEILPREWHRQYSRLWMG